MKFKSKIVFTVIVIFVFFILVSLIFNVSSMKRRGERDIEEYQRTEKAKVEKKLINYVKLAYSTVENNYQNATEPRYLSKFYGERLRNIIDVVESILDKEATNPQQIKSVLDKIRFNNGTGYVWAMTNERPYPKMIVEPIIPEIDGKVLDNPSYNNVNGTKENIFTVCSKLCADTLNHDGFLSYNWVKPGKGDVEVPKFAYVRYYKRLNCIIGTGIYIDDAIRESEQKSISDLRRMKYDDTKGYFWINNDEQPTPRLIMNPQFEKAEGKINDTKDFNIIFEGKEWNMYEAFLAKSKEGDGNFVEYKWTKREGTNVIYEVPKQSYVKYFKPLGWVIGSGLYLDDIDKEVKTKTETMQSELTSVIINYLLISILVSAIAIAVLIYTMNRHLKSRDIFDEDKNDNKSFAEKYAEDITPHTSAVVSKKVEEPKPIQQVDANSVIKTFMEEQTKLLTFNKLMEKTEISHENIKDLTEELKHLSMQIQASTQEVNNLITNIINKDSKV